jgi:hypothetical protein
MDNRVTSVIQTYQQRLYSSRMLLPRRSDARRRQCSYYVIRRIPVQLPRRWRTVLEGCGANSKQYGVL